MAVKVGDLSSEHTHYWDGDDWQWQPLWLKPDEVIEAAATAFGRSGTDTQYLADGLLNQSWRIDDYVLRVSRPERTREQVQYEHDVIGALHEHLDVVVPALKAEDGASVVDWKGRILSLFPFVHGISGTEVD
ncbi:MAG: phosphotransferase, partial [bacterium]